MTNPYVYGYPYQAPPPRRTNGLAIASMVVSIVGIAGLCAWGPLSVFVSPVGAILGHVARRRLKTVEEEGQGMALAGIILGWAGLVLSLIFLAVIIALIVGGFTFLPSDPSYYDEYYEEGS